jgi:1,4-dihydroxy-2-naphthoyl-CoA hydrolase
LSGPPLEQTPVPFEQALDGVLGFKVLSMTEERARGCAPITNRVRQMWGFVHGGVYSALAEMLAAEAMISGVYDERMTAVGLSNHTSFLRPVAEGTVHAEARGKPTWLWEVFLRRRRQAMGGLGRHPGGVPSFGRFRVVTAKFLRGPPQKPGARKRS